MSVFLRGSTYYLKARIGGRQVLRSLNTSDLGKAKRAAETLVALLQNGASLQPDTTVIPPSSQCPLPGPGETLGSLYEAFRKATERRIDQGHVRPSYLLDIQGLWSARLAKFSQRIVDPQLASSVLEHLDRQRVSVDRRRKTYTLFRRLAHGAGLKTEPHRFQTATPPRDKRPLTRDQLEACKQACLAYPHPNAKRIYLAAITGARIGEMMALGPEDVGLDYIRISKTRCRKTGKTVAAKTRNSNRTIPVASEVLEVVRPALSVQAHEWFPVWRTVRERAGLGVTGIHVLRHTWATNALAAGITPKAVSLALGHASVAFTEAQYASFLTVGHFRSELMAFNRGG